MAEQYRHSYLLASLSLLIVGTPFFAGLGRGIFTVLLGVVLLISIATCATNRYQTWFGMGMTAVILGSSVVADFTGGSAPKLVTPLMGLVYFAFLAWLVLSKIFVHTERVSTDTIQGAICAYLLLGIAWAFAYELISQAEPGAFAFSGPQIEGQYEVDRFLGFSFITLTTLGYGNVVPMTPRAEAVALCEAVVGQIYVAVLLARLVALELTHARSDHEG